MLEELDAPGEWFYDPVTSSLYLYPNTTDGTPGDEVVAPLLTAVVRIQGAHDIEWSGFEITETRATFLDIYEVPSGGDWSVTRSVTRVFDPHIPLEPVFSMDSVMLNSTHY